MAKWVDLDDSVLIEWGTMSFYPVELLGEIHETPEVHVHAHWKDRREDVFDCLDWGICSNCENLLPALAYCGFCGAEMDEEVSE